MTEETTDVTVPEARSVGQPTTLNEDRIAMLANIVEQGNYMTVACRVLKIPYGTYQTWRARGDRERLEGIEPADSIYVQLVTAIEEATAISEANLVNAWTQQAPLDWRAAKELLARRFPERWGNPERGGAGINLGGTTGEIKEIHLIMGGDQDQYMFPDPEQDEGGEVPPIIEGEFVERDDDE